MKRMEIKYTTQSKINQRKKEKEEDDDDLPWRVKMGVGSVALNVDFSEQIESLCNKELGNALHSSNQGFCFEEVK